MEGDRHPVVIYKNRVYKDVDDSAPALRFIEIEFTTLHQKEFDVVLCQAEAADQLRASQGGLQIRPLLIQLVHAGFGCLIENPRLHSTKQMRGCGFHLLQFLPQ